LPAGIVGFARALTNFKYVLVDLINFSPCVTRENWKENAFRRLAESFGGATQKTSSDFSLSADYFERLTRKFSIRLLEHGEIVGLAHFLHRRPVDLMRTRTAIGFPDVFSMSKT